MAILDKNAFMSAIEVYAGDRTDDDTLGFLADMRDTYNSLEASVANTVPQSDYDQLQGRYDELARNYRDRFLHGEIKLPKKEQEEEDDTEKRAKSVKFGDLFTQRNK